MSEQEYCEICGDWFPVNQEGEIQCDCVEDPYAENPRKTLDFND